MEITQEHLDIYKRLYPIDTRKQAVTLAQLKAHAASKPAGWLLQPFAAPAPESAPANVSDCTIAVGIAVFDSVLLTIGAVGLRTTLTSAKAALIAGKVVAEIPAIEEIIASVAGTEVTLVERGYGIVQLILSINDISLLSDIVEIALVGIAWYDIVLLGVTFIASVTALLGTGWLAVLAEIVAFLTSAYFVFEDFASVVITCGLNVTTPKQPPAYPPLPEDDPFPYAPLVAIKTSSGYIWSVVNGGGLGGAGAAIDTNIQTLAAEQKFAIESVAEGSTFALKTSGGYYVSAVGNGNKVGPNNATAPINTNATSVRDWERLSAIQQVDGTFAFATTDGYYLTAVNGGNISPANPILTTTATSIGPAETFSFVPVTSFGPCATNWWDGRANHIRVYYQVEDGSVYELSWDDSNGRWSGAKYICQATAGSGLAVVQYAYNYRMTLRLFYQDQLHDIRQMVWTNTSDWSQDSAVVCHAASGCGVAAVVSIINAPPQISVFVQDEANSILQYVSIDNGSKPQWTMNANLGAAAPGSAIAASIYSYNAAEYEVFYQNSSGQVMENTSNGGKTWTSHSLVNAASASGLATVYFSGGQQLRVYFQGSGGTIFELPRSLGAWGRSGPLPGTAAIASTFGAVQWFKNSISHVRVYYRDSSNNIYELEWDGKLWSSNRLVAN